MKFLTTFSPISSRRIFERKWYGYHFKELYIHSTFKNFCLLKNIYSLLTVYSCTLWKKHPEIIPIVSRFMIHWLIYSSRARLIMVFRGCIRLCRDLALQFRTNSLPEGDVRRFRTWLQYHQHIYTRQDF